MHIYIYEYLSRRRGRGGAGDGAADQKYNVVDHSIVKYTTVWLVQQIVCNITSDYVKAGGGAAVSSGCEARHRLP